MFRIVLLCTFLQGFFANADDNGWEGNWFPTHPEEKENLDDPLHGVKMGIPNKHCDDAKSRLEVDYYGSPVNYTCFENRDFYKPTDAHPIIEVEHIPKHYHATHYCMGHVLEYGDRIPTFGPHRPLWAAYGEYNFCPPQRWLHNLEHGAIVMLYHPCADPNEVKQLKQLLKACMWRHLITAYSGLKPERPMALLAWGYRLQMSSFDRELSLSFIKHRALKGAEHTSKDGKYILGLTEPALVVSDSRDGEICPNMN